MDNFDNIEGLGEELVAYALGDLDVAEQARMAAAIDADPRLQAELGAIEEAGARIVVSQAQHRAPSSLRSSVLGAVANEAADEASLAPVVPLQRASAPSSPRRRMRWVMPAVASVAVAASVLLAFVAIDARSDVSALEGRLGKIEAAASSARDGAPAGYDGANILTVATEGAMEQSSGSLVQVGDKSILLLRDVPDPGAGHSWQVWTASEDGTIQNVAQWAAGDKAQVIVLDDKDIVEVMVSHEKGLTPVPAPAVPPVADVKV
jgi:hypothetical protein